MLGAFIRVGTASAQCGPAAGTDNTACGSEALAHNTGNDDIAFGFDALFSNTTGNNNTASGFNALFHSTTGRNNIADGANALVANTTGRGNIGLGFNGGRNVVTGSNNIEIGGSGTSDESNTIRIGTNGTQKKTFIAGISGTGVSGAVVEVSSSGQLGVKLSSARYKRDIRDLGVASSGLMKLRPVVFRYRGDPSGQREYGLIAEEVARVHPELVDYDNDGKPLTVRYLELNAMLLNEVQKLTQWLKTKDRRLAAQQHEIEALKQQNASINALSERLAALEQQVRTANPQGFRSLASK